MPSRPSLIKILLLCLLNSNVFASQTIRVSVSSTGSQIITPPVGDWIETPSISADGRYVAFVSDAPNLVARDTNGVGDVFVHDRLTHKTERVSISSNGTQANAVSRNPPSISADGRYIAFESEASLVAGDIHKNVPKTFIHDRLTHKTTLVSVEIPKRTWNHLTGKYLPTTNMISLSSDGGHVAFVSGADDLIEEDNNFSLDIFVRDRLTYKTEGIGVVKSWEEAFKDPYTNSYDISISADGRYLAFSSIATNLVKGDTNKFDDTFVYDRVTHKTERVNVSTAGVQANSFSLDQSISANGRYVAFSTDATNLVPGDTNKSADVFVHDRLKHKTERVSLTESGKQGNADSIATSISADGRYVTFDSKASNLVIGDTNKTSDIFIHDRQTHKTERISFSSKGTFHGSYEPNISADGRHVVFVSNSTDLVDGDTNDSPDVFVYDRLLDTKRNADLTITPTTKPIALKLNTQGTYRYTITNNGKDTVPDVSLIHLVSGGSAVSFKPSQGTCNASIVETVCHLGKLTAGKKLNLRVIVKAQSKTFSQQVTVSGAPVDAVLANNQISVSTPVK